MALTVVLVCLLVQRVLAWKVQKPMFTWFMAYTARLETLCVNVTWWKGLGGVAVLLASVALMYLIIIGLLEHFLGIVFTFIFHAVVLWYYLDAGRLTDESMSLKQIFMNRYQNIFVILFWYILVGPLGVILYSESRRLEAHLESVRQEEVYFSEDFL